MRKFGVVGAGTMGRGIAETALLAGCQVVLLDAEDEIAAKGHGRLVARLNRGVERGSVSAEALQDMISRLTYGSDYSFLDGAEVVIEAVYEDIDVKKKVLAAVEQAVSENTIIGSNTSSLSISRMAEALGHPGRFLGIHFFNPVPVMKLVEIIPGAATNERTVEDALALAESLGKTAVVVKESPGFVVNRILCPLMNEAAALVMEGVASPADIDVAMKLGANHPIGPCALADLVGIDVLYAIMEVLHRETGDAKYRPCPVLKTMIAEGRLGRKTGRGFFTY